MLTSRTSLEDFVARLRIPASRREVIEQELLDHVESRIAAEIAGGRSAAEAEQIALASLGELETLRASIERVEPAFELGVASTIARGSGSAVATSIGFAIFGALIPHGPGVAAAVAVAVPAAVLGFGLMWLLAPRGIGAAMVAEARASLGSPPSTTRRRAVKGYGWSIVGVFHAIWGASLLGLLSDPIRDSMLMPWGLLGLVLGPCALVVFRRARRERTVAYGA